MCNIFILLLAAGKLSIRFTVGGTDILHTVPVTILTGKWPACVILPTLVFFIVGYEWQCDADVVKDTKCICLYFCRFYCTERLITFEVAVCNIMVNLWAVCNVISTRSCPYFYLCFIMLLTNTKVMRRFITLRFTKYY